MPLPSVSTPFDYLVNQVKRDLNQAVDLCDQIPKHRHLGKKHPELDGLKRSLESGPGFIASESASATGIPGADSDGADDFARADFTGYVRQVEEIVAQLEAIAYPPSRHHHHDWHPHYLLPFLSPHYYHKVEEHPHFHDLHLKWENVRDGIPQTFAQMRVRLAQKENDRIKKGEDEKKLKDDKKKLQDKVDEIQKENDKKLEDEEKHQKKERAKHEELEAKRDEEVEKLVKNKLGEDTIQRMDDLTKVIQHIHRAVTPRSSGFLPSGGYLPIPGYYPPDPPNVRGPPIRITNFNSNHDEEVEIEELDDDDIFIDNGSGQMGPFLPRGRSMPRRLPPILHNNVHGNRQRSRSYDGLWEIRGGVPVHFFPEQTIPRSRKRK